MSDTDSDPDVSTLTREVLADLDPGTIIDDRVILSKQQAAAVMGGGVTLAAVLGATAGSASAQSGGGTLGSEEEPIEATLGNFASESTASGYEITIDGDTYQINE